MATKVCIGEVDYDVKRAKNGRMYAGYVTMHDGRRLHVADYVDEIDAGGRAQTKKSPPAGG